MKNVFFRPVALLLSAALLLNSASATGLPIVSTPASHAIPVTSPASRFQEEALASTNLSFSNVHQLLAGRRPLGSRLGLLRTTILFVGALASIQPALHAQADSVNVNGPSVAMNEPNLLNSSRAQIDYIETKKDLEHYFPKTYIQTKPVTPEDEFKVSEAVKIYTRYAQLSQSNNPVNALANFLVNPKAKIFVIKGDVHLIAKNIYGPTTDVEKARGIFLRRYFDESGQLSAIIIGLDEEVFNNSTEMTVIVGKELSSAALVQAHGQTTEDRHEMDALDLSLNYISWVRAQLKKNSKEIPSTINDEDLTGYGIPWEMRLQAYYAGDRDSSWPDAWPKRSSNESAPEPVFLGPLDVPKIEPEAAKSGLSNLVIVPMTPDQIASARAMVTNLRRNTLTQYPKTYETLKTQTFHFGVIKDLRRKDGQALGATYLTGPWVPDAQGRLHQNVYFLIRDDVPVDTKTVGLIVNGYTSLLMGTLKTQVAQTQSPTNPLPTAKQTASAISAITEAPSPAPTESNPIFTEASQTTNESNEFNLNAQVSDSLGDNKAVIQMVVDQLNRYGKSGESDANFKRTSLFVKRLVIGKIEAEEVYTNKLEAGVLSLNFPGDQKDATEIASVVFYALYDASHPRPVTREPNPKPLDYSKATDGFRHFISWAKRDKNVPNELKQQLADFRLPSKTKHFFLPVTFSGPPNVNVVRAVDMIEEFAISNKSAPAFKNIGDRVKGIVVGMPGQSLSQDGKLLLGYPHDDENTAAKIAQMLIYELFKVTQPDSIKAQKAARESLESFIDWALADAKVPDEIKRQLANLPEASRVKQPAKSSEHSSITPSLITPYLYFDKWLSNVRMPYFHEKSSPRPFIPRNLLLAA